MRNTIFFILAVFLTLQFETAKAQPWTVKWSYTGDIVPFGSYVGTNNLQPLNFKANGVQCMTINATSGNVGIGLNYLTPASLLDVRGGDIDVATAIRGYMISHRYVLRHNGVVSDIFVGVGAGAASNASTTDNTLVGYNAGAVGNTALFNKNTLVGTEAGFTCQGDKNTFIGWRAGYNYSNPGQTVSTFVGAEAGFNESMGDEDVYIGWRAGYNSNGGVHNVFVGNVSGANNTNGSNNAFVGIGSGIGNQTGSNLALFGAGANVGSPGLLNAGAIGAGAMVMQRNQMIIGNATQFVGIGLSGDPVGPQNWLEINTPAPTPFPGASGLRFRDLTCKSQTVPNPGRGLLSVDCNGDVIYVPAPASTGAVFGNACGAAPVPMSSGWEIPTASFNYMINEPVLGGATMVGIGHAYSTCSNLTGKFEVLNSTYSHAGFFDNNASISGQATIGAGGTAISTLDDAIGLKGVANGASANGVSEATGVHGEAMTVSGCSANTGVRGFAQGGGSESRGGWFWIPNCNAPVNYGVKSVVTVNTGTAPQENFGGYFETGYAVQKTFGVVGSVQNPTPGISALPAGTNIAVYGYNPSLSPTPPAITQAWAGYFDGDVNINGNGWLSLSSLISSDRRFKNDLQPLDNVLEKLGKISGYSYKFERGNFPQKRFDSDRHIGLIAQEVKEVFPELVKQDAQGYYGVNYDGMVPVLVEAIKEQQKTIATLTERLDAVSKALGLTDQAGNAGETTMKNMQITLSDKDALVLNQNVPNPFADRTVISYNIPEGTGTAVIMFYDLRGKILNSASIETRGNGSLTVFGDDLSDGTYLYSLVIDGKTVETKRMTKAK